MQKIKVKRVLTYEGPEDEVRTALSKMYVKDDNPFIVRELTITSKTGDEENV